MSWTFHPATDFARHAARWQALNDAGSASPLLDPDFVAPLVEAFGSGSELLAVWQTGPEPDALALLDPRGGGMWETFQPSQAPVGPWVQARGLDTMALQASLLRALPGFPLGLGLTQCDPDMIARPADGGAVRTLDYIRTAHIDVEGSFDDYWAARGKNLRNNLKKQRNKLEKDGVTTRIEALRAPAQMAQAVADFGHLESAGWKAAGGTAIHPDNAQGLFYRLMLEAFARRGAACVYCYWFDGQRVAMDLCIEGNGTIIILKTTYDETVPNIFSPTLLMREEATRQIFDEKKFRKIEFYGKVMEWHTRWTDEIRTMYHVTTYRWPVLPALRQLAKRPAALLGQWRAARQATPS